jgi:ribosomal protein S26
LAHHTQIPVGGKKRKEKKKKIYQDNDITVQTIKCGVFVTPDKRIELATIESQAETHHKFDRMIAHTHKQIAIFQCVFGLFFGIGARVHHPRSTTELEIKKRKGLERQQ